MNLNLAVDSSLQLTPTAMPILHTHFFITSKNNHTQVCPCSMPFPTFCIYAKKKT